MNIGDRVRSRRQRLGMTQADLAAKVGVSDTTVVRWENSKNGVGFSVKTLKGAAEVLQMSVDELLGLEPPPPEALDEIEEKALELLRRLSRKQRLGALFQLNELARIDKSGEPARHRADAVTIGHIGAKV